MNTQILSMQVLPLPIKRSLISGMDCDNTNGNSGAWLNDEERIEYYENLVDKYKAEYDQDSIRMKWYVFAVCADGTYVLRSDCGYERSGITEDEFEIIKDGG